MSKYKAVIIEAPLGQRVVIYPHSPMFKMSSTGFPEYSSDLLLSIDMYPEYLLIKHLPPNEVFNYFIQNQT